MVQIIIFIVSILFIALSTILLKNKKDVFIVLKGIRFCKVW